MPLFATLTTSERAMPPVPVRAGKITASQTFRKGTYTIADAHEDGTQAALQIQGDNLVLDFQGAQLRGTPETTAPDQRQGTGLRVTGKNITIKNLGVHGYKIGIYAENAPGLRLINCDLSYNWKQHLASTREQEDLADWMSFHQNDKNEWLRFGAGIYLKACDRFEVRDCRITGGQCGLMITQSNRGLIVNNRFTYLSAIGIGFYRSSNNRVMHNNIDWCVRGYSHGVYNRGQDSAGILIYEQSHRNTFAYNSVTHGGDGFFLWAGQTTMDSGQGGCNDNLLFGNDFSHSPTNGIEATFSRNTFANNLLLECWHGIWGGYSYETRILGNVIGLNAEGIAIEHGQDNTIAHNRFFRDNLPIRLWANDRQDPNWGYPKNRDTRSRDYNITENIFADFHESALNARKTENIRWTKNKATGRPFAPALTEVTGFTFAENEEPATRMTEKYPPTMQPSGNPIVTTEVNLVSYLARFTVPWNPRRAAVSAVQAVAPTPIADGKDPFLKPGTLRGRRFIIIDEWGPYDFRRPLLHLREVNQNQLDFETLGPAGNWSVKRLSPGLRLVNPTTGQPVTGGRIGEKVRALLTGIAGKARDLEIELVYTGKATTDHRGVTSPVDKPVAFGFADFFAPIDWTVRFFQWDNDTSDPRTQADGFAARLKEAPLATLKTDRLDFAGYGRFAPAVPANYFATVAEGDLEIDDGEYVLEATTDDGLRVWVDDRPAITDAWKYQGPTVYTVPLTLGGKHRIRVEHFQIDGYATLQLRLRKTRP